MVFKTSRPDSIKENLNSSTRHQLNETKKEIHSLEGLGKISNKESNIAINEILSKIGYADIRSSLNIENISLRIGQTKELAKIGRPLFIYLFYRSPAFWYKIKFKALRFLKIPRGLFS